ncbi:MAG: mechanosensitive ion channel [Crocinitomix sp.]|nr:mechanosensitive ion channel [Crocinitomix sp.]
MEEFLKEHSRELIGTAIAIGGWILLRLIVGVVVRKRLRINGFNNGRKRMAVKSFNIVLNLVFIAALVTTWSVEQEDILLLLSSIVTVLGIAFFAQWSHLSNITSGVIIFLSTSTKIGDNIRIMDKDFDLEGEIFDIGLMFFKLRNAQGEIISLPNNIILQKAIKTNPGVVTDEAEGKKS